MLNELSCKLKFSFFIKKILFSKCFLSSNLTRKDVKLPQSMQRAMATEAEASREARAKVISAEGDKKAAHALKEAADILNQSPVALQLRYLQTLSTIAAEKNSTIIFPIPMDMFSHFSK